MSGATIRTPAVRIKIQIYCGEDIAMGPGKADLLDAIAREGSISAAGRALRMSYRRCWMLVDVMNRCWASPLVATHSGGARLTDAGTRILQLYRALQAAIGEAAGGHEGALLALLRDEPLPVQAEPDQRH